MAVNSTEITSLFSSLVTSVENKYTDLYNNQSIDAETYAKLMSTATLQVMELAARLVQQQEQIDMDIELKEQQKELINSQIVGAEYDNQVKLEQVTMSVYERTFIQPKQLEKLESDILLSKEQEKLTYTERIGKDKEVATMGLDTVLKDINATPETIYTPKYKATV